MTSIVKKLTRAGIIAGLYTVLVFPVISVASGFIQFRPSEALTLLPAFFPESVFAVAIGCLLANVITGCQLLDIIFGSLVTLLAGVCTHFIGKLKVNKHAKFVLSGLPPVLLNAFLLPVIWYFAYGELLSLYLYNVISLLISQTVSVYLLGGIVYYSVDKFKGLNNPLFE